MKNKFIFLIIILGCLTAPVFSSSLNELINSYDYDFISEKINITSIQDIMIDTNSNQINDTLYISFIANMSNQSYIAIVIIDDESLMTNYTYLTQTSNNISFPTYLLTNDKFNYTIEIRDDTYSLLYRKTNLVSKTYTNYEKGFQIKNISDNSNMNNSIELTILLENISIYQTMPVFIELLYEDNSILITNNVTLSTQNQTIIIPISNDTIKHTHHIGNYTITSLTIGQKKLPINYTTKNYDYENFAKTSYIKSVNHSFTDENNNSFYDMIQVSINTNIKSAGNYTLEFTLIDNNYFNMQYNKTAYFAQGNQEIIFNITPEIFYRNKLDGPYYLKSFQLVRESNLTDYLKNTYETIDISYMEFEKPALADITLEFSPSYYQANNSTSLNLNITNIGTYPAFNIKVEIFGANGYSYAKIIPKLDINESYEIITLDTYGIDGSLYTVIVDLKNEIDELDESNNIMQEFTIGPSSINIEQEINILEGNAVEIILTNKGTIPITDAKITFDNTTVNLTTLYPKKYIKLYLEKSLNITYFFNYSITSRYFNENFTFIYDYSNISISHEILDSTNSTIIQYIIENHENYNIIVTFDNERLVLNSNSKIFLFKEYAIQPQSISILEKGLTREYNLTYSPIDYLGIINLRTLELDSSSTLYEIILNNSLNRTKNITFTFDNITYSNILNSNNIKRMYVESSLDNLEIENINITLPEVFEKFNIISDGSNYIYEIGIINSKSQSSNISFNLGQFSYQSNFLAGERKVLFIEQNENELEIDNLIIE